MYVSEEELRERAEDWERFAAEPDCDPETAKQYAELARLDRAELARIDSVSF